MRRELDLGRGRRRRATASTVVALVALALFAGACGDGGSPGGDDEDHAAVERTVRALQHAFAKGDRQRLCSLMDATARRQAGLVAHGQPEACPKDLAEAFEVIDAGGGMGTAPRSKPVGVSVTGGTATATLALAHGGRVDVPLTRKGGAWRLGTFFGTPPRQAEAAAAVRAPVARTGRAATVGESGGLPCFPLVEQDYPEIAGGCTLGFSGRVTLRIDTVFGRFEFGKCELGLSVLTDGEGRAWTSSVGLRGPDNVNNGCSDVRGCENAAGEELPWMGRISAVADGYLIRMRACFDTCIGFYAGPLTVRLTDGQRGRIATAANAGVGASGLRFDGPLRLTSSDVELAAASR